MLRPQIGEWDNMSGVTTLSFVCGYCGNLVASNRGWDTRSGYGCLRICSACSGPTFFYQGNQIPGSPYGKPITELPPEIEQLYEEARSAVSNGAPTAAVLCCRKLLMHVAVDRKAEEGKSFQYYVAYLADNHFIPAGAREWVDQIRTQSNEANHQIVLKTRKEAEDLIDFVEMLLKVVYEYPARAKSKSTSN